MMKEEYKTTHGLAEIILPDETSRDRLEASRNLADCIDEFCWKGGASNLSVTANDIARINWKLTSGLTVEYNGKNWDLRKLENAEDKACTVECAACRHGDCYFFREEKLTCSRLKRFYDEQFNT